MIKQNNHVDKYVLRNRVLLMCHTAIHTQTHTNTIQKGHQSRSALMAMGENAKSLFSNFISPKSYIVHFILFNVA